MSSADLERILKRVRAIIAKAENLTIDAEKPGVSDSDRISFLAEAEASRTMADALMLQYAITEIGQENPADRVRPMIMTINIGQSSEVTGYITWLMQDLAEHCRCRVRAYTGYTSDGWSARVYGFESDVRYFELMYTAIRLHMLGVLLPRIDNSQSLEENAYRLHNSGYNWLQIAEMYGWESSAHYRFTRPAAPSDMKVPYWHADEGWKPSTYVGGIYKRAYHRACKERGETAQKIASNGTAAYRKSAADGYVGMIVRRLAKMRSERDSGAALILRSRIDDLDALFREDNPDLFPTEEEREERARNSSGRKIRSTRHRTMTINVDAYRRGAEHARTADLDGSGRMPGGGKSALGG